MTIKKLIIINTIQLSLLYFFCVIVFLLHHKTWNTKKMSIFCHFLTSWLTQAWMFFLSCSTTCTKFR